VGLIPGDVTGSFKNILTRDRAKARRVSIAEGEQPRYIYCTRRERRPERREQTSRTYPNE
jgi:hypothetical protein